MYKGEKADSLEGRITAQLEQVLHLLRRPARQWNQSDLCQYLS